MMTGNETRIRFWDDNRGKKETRKLDGNDVGIETMFVFMNSSVCLSSLELDCGVEGVGTARVLGSNVVVSLCSIRSNMECSPFVVCWMGETDWSSITVTSSSHVSSCSPSLLPLVEICDDSIGSGKTAPNEQLDRIDQNDRTDGWTPSVSITGSSIEFGDGDLILGTGPLIGSLDRAGNEEMMKSVSTSLVGCVLVNMTSRCSSELSEVGSWFGQSIVGSVVTSCSNHLYGTSIRSLNGGGSLLSLNSSFLSCLVDATNNNIAYATRIEIPGSSSSFSFTLCTFKECSTPSAQGGAIYSYDRNVDFSIDSCSFDSCSAGSRGGAVCIVYLWQTKNTITVQSSLFKSCSAHSGGSLYVTETCITTISECVFMDSEAPNWCGAVYLHRWSTIYGGSISNSLFENCAQNDTTSGHGGGAIVFEMCSSVQLTSLLFKHCYAASNRGHLIYSFNGYATISSTTFSNCASDSPLASLIYVYNNYGTEDRSDVISRSPAGISLISLTADVKGTTADVEVTLDQEVDGTLLVVVSNIDRTREEVTDGIPNIGRVLEFSIPSSSSIGSCSVSVGETGLLQTPLSDYFIVSAFLPGHVFTQLTTPPRIKPSIITTLLSASCSLDASHTEATVHFEGKGFEDGQYKVTLQGGSTMEVELSKGPDGKSTGSTYLGVIGSDPKWIEGTTWIVKEMTSVLKPEMSIEIDHPVSFTIPRVARLSEIEVSELDALTKGKVRLSFLSVELEKGVKYTLTLVGQDSDKKTLTREVTTTVSGNLGELSEVLYPFETDPAEQMKFGVLYKVTSLKATGRSNSVQFGLVGVQMPVEPVRLTKIAKTDETETSLKLLLTGSGFVVSETYAVEVSGVATGSGSSIDHTRTFTVVASDATSATSSILVLSSSDPFALQFGQTYTVTKIDNGTNPGIVVGSPSFSTPALPPLPAPTPRLASAVCSLDDSHTEVTVSFEGTDFEAGQYKVTLQDDTPLDVLFSKSSDGKWIGLTDLGVIGSDGEWIEGTTWIVKEVKSVTDTALLIEIAHPVSFTIPAVARLSQIEVSEVDVSSEGEWKVTLSFLSVELEKGVKYTLTLVGQDSDKKTLTREVTTTVSGNLGELSEVLYPFETDPAEQMKFGVLYKVTSLKATGRSNSVQVGSVVIQMPVEPVRLTKIAKTDETETSLKLLLTGSGFVPKETNTVEVSGVATEDGSSNAHPRTFTVVASDATSATSSILVLSSSDPFALQFGQTYTVTKIDNGTNPGIVVGTPSFSTPPQPENLPATARITNTSIEVNSQSILLSIILTGEHLPSDSTFVLTLNETITIPVSFTSSTKGKSEVVMLGLDGSLDFGKTYSITDLSNGGLKVIADGIHISTPPKPTELTLCVCSDDSGDASTIRSGADVSMCLRMERAWNLASQLSIANTMMRIVKPASLSTPLLVSSLPFKLTSGNMDQSLLSLSQPSSMTNSDGSLLSITNGECGLTLLTITTSSSSSFVFISAQSSTITIQMCSIEGTSSTEWNSEGSICGWKTGFLHFVESKTNLSSVTLKGLGSGGIVQKGGELTISKGEFSDNGQTNSSFPSARQNIHCEGEGKLTISSLAQGDGTKNTPSAWIEADECTISGDQDIVSSPLFVPTLDSDTSSTNFEKKSNTMHFTVKGEMLVPCGLDVEVFEWDSSKSVKGESALLSLHSLATTKWTSTEIVGQVDLKTSLSSLKSSLDWRGRLVFGDNRTTSNSFLFASASSTGKGNMSQGGVASKMLWIIPIAVAALLAVAFLVVLVCLIRVRKDRKQKSDLLLSHQEMDAQNEVDIEKVEVTDGILPNSTGSAHLSSQGLQKGFSYASTGELSTLLYDSDLTGEMVDVIELDGKEHTATKVRAVTTLHSKLHKENALLHPQLIQRHIAFGLSQVLSTLQTKDALTQLTSHWVLFDNKDRMFLQIANGDANRLGVSGASGKKGINGSNEGLRWGAPEQKEDATLSANDVDVEKVSVFRLGLLLWEMETGDVPFKEVDAVNAHRQVVSGIRPDLTKVPDSSMRALIQSCLHQTPEHRPTLATIKRDLNNISAHVTRSVDNLVPLPLHS
ncbi:hypothetical protein BLNAU_20797 [Blattamonas nauphoetae]|uniref:Protein kinase domain-containing protein n=1 Tax=Blattamonas nauphoetae TaxID=2049346 RepID=A0ABQ9WXP9_9EUKA|nr:hypothetical protein BLNAU_20797 [Blattamonas nauphoetae]